MCLTRQDSLSSVWLSVSVCSRASLGTQMHTTPSSPAEASTGSIKLEHALENERGLKNCEDTGHTFWTESHDVYGLGMSQQSGQIDDLDLSIWQIVYLPDLRIRTSHSKKMCAIAHQGGGAPGGTYADIVVPASSRQSSLPARLKVSTVNRLQLMKMIDECLCAHD
jgi:hypothetical protein